MTSNPFLQKCSYLLCAGLTALCPPALAMDPEPRWCPQAAQAAAAHSIWAIPATAAAASASPAATAAASASPAATAAASASPAAAAAAEPSATGLAAAAVAPSSATAAAPGAKATGTTVAIAPTPTPIPDLTGFIGQPKHSPANKSPRVFNLRQAIEKRETHQGAAAFAKFSTAAKAAVHPEHRVVAIGTDNPDTVHHYLMVVDLDRLQGNLGEDPLLAYAGTNEEMNDTKWVTRDYLICATGKGDLKLWRHDSQKNELVLSGEITNASGATLRELALSPNQNGVVAMGGYERKLKVFDLHSAANAQNQTIALPGVIGSLRWPAFNNGSYISATTDEGQFYLFDPRAKTGEFEFFLDTGKKELFAHEFINNFGVLLGFGDGSLHFFDLRIAKVIHTVKDPYVGAIGGIEADGASQRLLTSGETDFTVWQVGPAGKATAQAHAEPGIAPLQNTGVTGYALFSGPDEVVNTNSNGQLQVSYLEQ